MGVVRSQKVPCLGEHKTPRNVFFEEADGGLRPEQTIKECRINTQLSSERLRLLRLYPVEMIKNA
jgi:hypothetical protein